MSLKDDINDMKKEVKSVKEMNKQSIAKEMLEDYKRQNKRLFIVALVELGIIIAIVIGFLWYISLPIDEISMARSRM